MLHNIRHELCRVHHKEYLQLHEQYKVAEVDYDKVSLDERSSDDQRRQKIALGNKALKLRNEVNHRFFSLAADNRGHIRWMLKLNSEISVLQKKLDAIQQVDIPSGSDNDCNQAETQSGSVQYVYRSYLDPELPMSALDHLPRDHIVVQMKELISSVTEAFLSRLYRIAPSLNDSGSEIERAECERGVVPDAGDYVIRFLFREYLLLKSDTEVLYKASTTDTIDAFLRKSGGDMHDYIKFFEAFGRPDTLHLLRDAVCDYLFPPETAGTKIIGAAIRTDDTQRKMTVEGWDILFSHFSEVVDWYNVEQFCASYDDLLLIKRLIAFGRYGKAAESQPGWLNPTHDVSQECPLAVLQGFVAVTKGFSDPPMAQTTVENGMEMEQRSRCYLVGRMGKQDALAKALMQELLKRVAKYIVIVYEGQDRFERTTVYRNDDDKDPWITRRRAVQEADGPTQVPWRNDWSLEHVNRDLQTMRSMRERNMSDYYTYYEYIIIDRESGHDFAILDDVATILARVSGCRSIRQIINQAVKASIPGNEQENYIAAAVASETTEEILEPFDARYEGSRIRSWELTREDTTLLCSFLRNRRSRTDVGVTRALVAEMESHGLINALTIYEPAHTCPVILQGEDGIDDIYFPYNLGRINKEAVASMFSIVEPRDKLLRFAYEFKAGNPTAIFAKGRIHVHYCAWPMPAIKHGVLGKPTFRTVEGHLYRWNVLPFDTPLSPRLWQYYVNNEVNKQLPFVYVVETTFVVCAKDIQNAHENLKTLLSAVAKHEWKLLVLPPSRWTTHIDSLQLDKLWGGCKPAL